MTYEEKKHYLKSYRIYVEELYDLNERIEEYRLNKMFPSVVNDGMPHGSDDKSDLSSYAAKLTEMEADREKKKKICRDTKRAILRKIDELEQKDEWLVLRLRYINLMSWFKIADVVGCSKRNAMRTHGKALNHLKW